jgi:RNA polymerase sigma-70 factor, ECF subfamily
MIVSKDGGMAEPPGDPLLAGLAGGRDEAFAALFARDGPALFRVAYALLRSRPDAEDAVQEVFVGLAQSRAGLADVENLRAYLFTALRHAAAKIAARRPPVRPAPQSECDAVTGSQVRSIDTESAARLEQALAMLPAIFREAIALKIDGGLTFREMATVLGVSPNTAASRYRYALAELRDALKGWTDE